MPNLATFQKLVLGFRRTSGHLTAKLCGQTIASDSRSESNSANGLTVVFWLQFLTNFRHNLLNRVATQLLNNDSSQGLDIAQR